MSANRMDKTTCFRIKTHLHDALQTISKASGIPVSSLVRHCITTEIFKLAKQYGVDVRKN